MRLRRGGGGAPIGEGGRIGCLFLLPPGRTRSSDDEEELVVPEDVVDVDPDESDVDDEETDDVEEDLDGAPPGPELVPGPVIRFRLSDISRTHPSRQFLLSIVLLTSDMIDPSNGIDHSISVLSTTAITLVEHFAVSQPLRS